jgi:chromosome segregation ATPase
MVVEAQTDAGRGGASVDHMMRVTNELKDVRVELKKLEADRERLSEQYGIADRDRAKLESKLAQIEVELHETQHARMQAESGRQIATDALAKAEVARHRSAEEAITASKARDAASSGGDDSRRELERMKRRVTELEKQGAPAAGPDPAEIQREREAAERKLKTAEERAAAAERSHATLQAEVDAAKTDAAKARAEAARARAAADSQAEAIVGSPTDGNALATAAREVYEAINDILSEMRNNMVLVQGELPNLKSDDDETMQAVSDAVEALVDNAETAKGALRNLRDLADGK